MSQSNNLIDDLDCVIEGKIDLVYETIDEFINGEGLSTTIHDKFRDNEARIYLLEDSDDGVEISLLHDSKDGCDRAYIVYGVNGKIHAASL